MQTFEKLRLTSEPTDWDELGVPAEAREEFAKEMLKFVLNDAHGFWMPPESLDGHCDPDQFVNEIATRVFEMGTFYNGAGTQSPIEDRMAGALMWIRQDWLGFPRADMLNGPDEHLEMFGPSEDLRFYLSSQAKVAGYKVDFMLWFIHGSKAHGVAVECDGHAFHEKTKEQAAKDKLRDREILKAGFPVMRFSGSEIYKDAGHCADQVSDVLKDVLVRLTPTGGSL